jgi:hypothetical protein
LRPSQIVDQAVKRQVSATIADHAVTREAMALQAACRVAAREADLLLPEGGDALCELRACPYGVAALLLRRGADRPIPWRPGNSQAAGLVNRQ